MCTVLYYTIQFRCIKQRICYIYKQTVGQGYHWPKSQRQGWWWAILYIQAPAEKTYMTFKLQNKHISTADIKQPYFHSHSLLDTRFSKIGTKYQVGGNKYPSYPLQTSSPSNSCPLSVRHMHESRLTTSIMTTC